MTRPAAVALVLVLAVASLVPAVGAGALAAPEHSAGALAPEDRDGVAQVGNQSVDSTEFRITVYGNASARWVFLYKTTLENETQRSDFESYADRFNSEETELYTNFRDRARSITTQGPDATGRSMNATGFSKRAYVDELNSQGVVRMSFVWTAFAERDGDAVVMGDVFEGGFYLAPDQRLVVLYGPNLRFQSAAPQPALDEDSLAASDTLTWDGEREFNPQRPEARLVPPSEPTPTPTPTTAGGGGTTATEPGRSVGFLPVLGLGVVLLLGLGAALAYRAGALPGDDDGAAAASAEPGDGGDGAAAAAAGTGGAAADTTSTEPAVADEELLDDEERVMRLLDRNGGRMKQVVIVDETGWSKSKVSMLLSDMEEAGEISKLRVGRENIISKKGMEPDAAGSPFDDEE